MNICNVAVPASAMIWSPRRFRTPCRSLTESSSTLIVITDINLLPRNFIRTTENVIKYTDRHNRMQSSRFCSFPGRGVLLPVDFEWDLDGKGSAMQVGNSIACRVQSRKDSLTVLEEPREQIPHYMEERFLRTDAP